MNLIVTTPLHAPGNAFIEETYRSLCAQTFANWRWRILPNRGGKVPDAIATDSRVVLLLEGPEAPGVGALKRRLCDLSGGGELFVELDADDLLVPEALERIVRAFERGADFVYSDFAEFQDETWKPNVYSADFGWESYPFAYDGHELVAMRAPNVTPHNLRLVDWAPNHVRAWTRALYEKVGGHDPAMTVGDDHDLVVRMFLAGARFTHIPECLYLYRVHPKNTVATDNAAIRRATHDVYEKYLWKLAERWCQGMGLRRVDLCGGHDSPEGYEVLDQAVAPHPNLDERWPLADSSVGILRAHDAVEHLRDPVHTMNEAWRVLAPGGWLMISVPSTHGLGAFCDPTHKSFWNKLSFRYYVDKRFARYVSGYRGRFQLGRDPLEWFPTPWHKAENVPYAEAHLFANKDGWRAMGAVMI